MNINLTASHKESYYSQIRRWPLLFNLKTNSKILDIGCGQGVLGEMLMNLISANVCGLEITEKNFKIASNVLDRSMLCDVENMDISVINDIYDYIIFSDSLEHLIDPAAVLNKIKPLLADDGAILISLPNVRNFRVILPLIFQDQWQYTEEGLLDKTHLRFFTIKSITALLLEAEYQVESFYYDLPLSSKVGMLNKCTFGLFKKILTSHYFIKVCHRKKY